MSRLKVKNWRKFQHYKGRTPPWIKLDRVLLDDFDFACLPIASKALASLLWLLASESHDGSVESDVDRLAFRLRWQPSDVADGLNPLIEKGFLVSASNALAERLQDACAEGEGEGEGERAKEPNPNGLGVGLSSDAAGAKDLLNGSTNAKPKRKACPITEIVALYHETLPILPHVEVITKARAGYLRQRWLNELPSLDAWRNYFTDVSKSPFLTGKVNGREGKPPFVADLEWLSRPGNFAKVAEGRYHRE